MHAHTQHSHTDTQTHMHTHTQAREHDLLMPVHRPEQGDDYTGATVIEPDKGWDVLNISIN